MKTTADNLKRGDLVTGWDGQEVRPQFVATVTPDHHLPNVIVTFFGDRVSQTWSTDFELEIITGLLSPSQLYADDLHSYLRSTLECLDNGTKLASHYAEDMRALLDQIEPPKPPSAKELAQALAALSGGVGSSDVVNRLLERCRRADLLPKQD